MSMRLYVWQRMTAALMVPLIVIHLIVIFYATNNGLSAVDILDRTRGSYLWALYYGTFVIAAAIHAAIGLRSVASDWTSLRPAALNGLMWSAGAVLLMLGLRAIAGVVLPGVLPGVLP